MDVVHSEDQLPTVCTSAIGDDTMDDADPEDQLPIVSASAIGDHVVDAWRRSDTSADLPIVASRFGEDLASPVVDVLPRDWLEVACAKRVLFEEGIPTEEIDVLEVFAGTARWAKACQAAGLRAGPVVDIVDGWDLSNKRWRRAFWAVIVVCQPKWVHLLVSLALSGRQCHTSHARRPVAT